MTSDADPRTAADPSVDQVQDLTARPILEFGRGWMTAPATAERAVELGLIPGFGFWVNGRAGVLGEVDADVAAAAIGFMAPATVREIWGVRRAGISPLDVAHGYADAAAEWGRSALAAVGSDDLERLTELCHKVAAAALPSCGILFAGWRNLDRGQDPAGRATVALNIVRELRGGAHLSAVHAVGIEPLGAIMSADDPVRGGEAGAARFGWTGPYPPPDPRRRAEAETITSLICRPAYEALDGAERSDFVRLVTMVRACVEV